MMRCNRLKGAVCGGGIVELEAVWCWGGQCEVYGEMCSAGVRIAGAGELHASGNMLGRVAVVVCWGAVVVWCPGELQ